jgi:glutathione synthase/RimK-type ligase-like ATP-grasp enzyme
MKIGILHEKLEWTEQELERIFTQRGIEVARFDIRDTSAAEISAYGPDILLNRVYASVGNRNFPALAKTIGILERLEENSVLAVNSANATKADYGKFFAYQAMKRAGISTPTTVVYDSQADLEEVLSQQLDGLPIIVKRDSGGRGVDVAKCDTLEEVTSAISAIQGASDYNGMTLLQQFVIPAEDRDYRVCVIDGEVVYHHGRSLIALKPGEAPWLASRSRGSTILPIEREVPQELAAFATNAANSIGAILDVLDIVRTDNGYTVIEHNPTPNFRPEYEEALGFSPVELLAQKVLDAYTVSKGVAAK